jgi:hypothetical protein
MTIASSGNVGIGTTTPGYKLDITSDTTNFMRILKSDVVAADGFFSVSNYTISANTMAPIFQAKSNTPSYPGVTFLGDTKFDSGAVPIMQFESRYINGPSTVRPLMMFGAYNSLSDPTKRAMIILSNLNVGIGTSTPDAKLDVAGNIFASTSGAVDLALNNTAVTYGKFTLRSMATPDAGRLDILGGAAGATTFMNIAAISVVKRGKVRRARLYYLRGLIGKKARIKELKFFNTTASKN